MTRRRYSDDDRSSALAALAALKGNVRAAARRPGVPQTTPRQWARGTRHPEARDMAARKRQGMAEALDAVAWKLIEAAEGKVQKANLQQVMTALGIAIDKARLLRDRPTSISAADARPLALFRERYEQADGRQAAKASQPHVTADDRREVARLLGEAGLAEPGANGQGH